MYGYHLPIAMEVRRGRYLPSYGHPSSLIANQPQQWPISLRDHDHAFFKGHRWMAQVQPTRFPVIDRNPRKCMASHLVLPVAGLSPTDFRIIGS